MTQWKPGSSLPPWHTAHPSNKHEQHESMQHEYESVFNDVWRVWPVTTVQTMDYDLYLTSELSDRISNIQRNGGDMENVFAMLHGELPEELTRDGWFIRDIEVRHEDDYNRYQVRKALLHIALERGTAPYLKAPAEPDPTAQVEKRALAEALAINFAQVLARDFAQVELQVSHTFIDELTAIEINTASLVEPSQTEEDTDMGFGKKGKFPDKIVDLDYSNLRDSQVWVLADFVNARSQIVNLKQTTERRAALKKACEANPSEAQRGYELVVLLKKPNDTMPVDAQEHYVNLLIEILNKYSADLDAAGKSSLQKIVEGMQAQSEKLKSTLTDFAKQAVRDAADKRAPFVIKEGTKTRKVKGVLPPEFKRMVELASERIPIMLVGPAGCGKTYLGEKLAEALDMDFSDQSCSEGMSESVFNGLLLPIGAGGEFKHVSSPFMDRYEAGGVMLLDEIDAGDPNLFTYINKAVANSSYTVAQRYKTPRVDKHADFVLVAAANTYGNGADAMYVGRNQLDAATLDRFKVGLITMDYCREVEEDLAPQEVCKWAWQIREKIKTNKLRRIMSTRVIKDIGRMTERYKWTLDDWNKCYFTSWTDAEKKLVGVAA